MEKENQKIEKDIYLVEEEVDAVPLLVPSVPLVTSVPAKARSRTLSWVIAPFRKSNLLAGLLLFLFISSILLLTWKAATDDGLRVFAMETAQKYNLVDAKFLKKEALRALGQRKMELCYRIYKLYYAAIEKECSRLERSIALGNLSALAFHYDQGGGEAMRFVDESINTQLRFRGPRDPWLAKAYSWKSATNARDGQVEEAIRYARKAGRIVFAAADPNSTYYKDFERWYHSIKSRNPKDVLLFPGGWWGTSSYFWHSYDSPEIPLDVAIPLRKALRADLDENPNQDSDKAYAQVLRSNGSIREANEQEVLYDRDSAFQKAIEAATVQYGKDSPRTATIMNDFACSLRARSRIKEAIEWEEKVDAIRSKQKKPTWLDEGVPLDGLDP